MLKQLFYCKAFTNARDHIKLVFQHAMGCTLSKHCQSILTQNAEVIPWNIGLSEYTKECLADQYSMSIPLLCINLYKTNFKLVILKISYRDLQRPVPHCDNDL